MMKPIVIDAASLVLGRMASEVAKRLLSGESVVIVNAEKAVISGARDAVIRSRTKFLKVGGYQSGPLHPRRPDGLVRRTIRGMLPYRKPKGRTALKRLKVYVGIPRELVGSKKETIKGARSDKLKHRFITVEELAIRMGWKGKGDAKG